MMLVQKQPAFNLTPVVHPHHRRNPSAPPTVLSVQPTRTPGMLSISKPQRTTPQRQMVSQQRQPAPRTAPKAKVQPQQNPAQISPKKPADLAASSPNSRGRAHKQPKDNKRSSTPSPVRSRHTRQPSPPAEAQIQSLQAEEQAPSHNQFDPFIQSSTSPALSESVPVPSKVVRPQLNKMSRSAPKPSTMAPRPPRTFNFPICDDDLSEPESAGVPTPPATPMRRNTFEGKGSPEAASKVRRHRRAPSEGVFAMSSDDELSASSESVSPVLFGVGRPRRPPVTPAPSFTRTGGFAAAKELSGSPPSGQKGAGFFASSVFQNSPSPDELPNPLLF